MSFNDPTDDKAFSKPSDGYDYILYELLGGFIRMAGNSPPYSQSNFPYKKVLLVNGQEEAMQLRLTTSIGDEKYSLMSQANATDLTITEAQKGLWRYDFDGRECWWRKHRRRTYTFNEFGLTRHRHVKKIGANVDDFDFNKIMADRDNKVLETWQRNSQDHKADTGWAVQGTEAKNNEIVLVGSLGGQVGQWQFKIVGLDEQFEGLESHFIDGAHLMLWSSSSVSLRKIHVVEFPPFRT